MMGVEDLLGRRLRRQKPGPKPEVRSNKKKRKSKRR